MTIDKQTPLLEKHFAYRHQADKMDTVKLGEISTFPENTAVLFIFATSTLTLCILVTKVKKSTKNNFLL